MKIFIYLLLGLTSFILTGCGLDNYEAPSSDLLGQILFEGEPVRVRGTGEAVQLQLYQDGYELDGPIPVYVHQDGSFEAKLFDGVYKMVTRDNNGPWVNTRDTTVITINNTTRTNLEVTPYFTISDVSLNLNGNSLDGAFYIDQIVPDRELGYTMLLLGETNFVDDVVNISRLDAGDSQIENITNMTMDISRVKEVKEARSLFARIGVMPVGADQAIYSEVMRVR